MQLESILHASPTQLEDLKDELERQYRLPENEQPMLTWRYLELCQEIEWRGMELRLHD